MLHVIRNPFDAILSFYSFDETHSHTEKTKTFIPIDKLTWYVKQYSDHYLYWANVPTSRMLVKYEDLKSDAVNELRRVNRFLLSPPLGSMTDMFVPDDKAIRCAVGDDSVLPYKSSTSKMNIMHGIDDLDRVQVKYIVESLAEIMCGLGYAEMYNVHRQNRAQLGEDVGPYLDCFKDSVNTVISFITRPVAQ